MTTSTYTATIRLGHGIRSVSGQEPGDVIMHSKFEFKLVTAAEDTPESHRELVMRVIDELHKTLKECTCNDEFFAKTSAEVIQEDADRMQETS